MCKEEMVELKSKYIPNDVRELAGKLEDVYKELINKDN